MSDSRVHIKVEFTAYGKTSKWDASINWFESDNSGCDLRITDWFDAAYHEAFRLANAKQIERDNQRRIEENEAHERSELARLQAKYAHPAAGETR